MRWINDVVFAILAAHAWGCLMQGIWLLAVRRLKEKGFSRMLFHLLRCVVIAYILPFGFCLLTAVDGYIKGWDGRLFELTPVISKLGLVLFIVWIIGLCMNFGDIWREWRMTRRIVRDAEPADEATQRRFKAVCKEIRKRPGRVKLYRKSGLKCGITSGILDPRIVLPEGEMDPLVEKVTLIHELIHYKRRDLWFIVTAKFIETVHWFNPWTRGLSTQMSQWSEYACDYESGEALGDMKEYAQVLFRVATGAGVRSGLFSSIGTEPMTLSRRIEMMINMQKAKKRPKVLGAIITAAVSLASVTSTFAATGAIAQGYRMLYDLTEVESDDNGVQVVGEVMPLADTADVPQYPDNSNINPEDYVNTGIVFNDVLPIDGYTLVEDEDDIAALSTGANFTWTIPYDYLQTSKYFWITKGEKITVSGDITPSGKILRVGIIEPDGARRCIYATGSFAYNFATYYTGEYKVYAINDNSDPVTINGAYVTY